MAHIQALRACFAQIPMENKERIEFDVDELVQRLVSFGTGIKNEVCPNNNKYMICLNGLLPIYHKGVNYNIPLGIYLNVDYPFSAPIYILKPNSDMTIQAGDNVMPNGTCIHACIGKDWSPSSTLYRTLMIFSAIFGDYPPLYSTKKPENPNPSTQSTLKPQPVKNPTSPSSTSFFNSPKNIPSPATSTIPSVFATNTQSAQQKNSASQPINQSNFYQQPQPSINQPNYYYTTTTNTNPSATVLQKHGSEPSMSKSTAALNKNLASVAAQNNSGRNSFPLDQSSSYKMPISYNDSNNSSPQLNSDQSLEILLADKLKATLEPRVITLEDELTDKQRMKQQLAEKNTKFNKSADELTAKIEKCQKKIEQAERYLTEYNNQFEFAKKNTLSIEECIFPKNVPSEQGLEVLAEIEALEDAISQLGEALKKKSITLEQYVVTVREIGREIYQKKVLSKKILARKEDYDSTVEKLRKNAGLQ